MEPFLDLLSGKRIPLEVAIIWYSQREKSAREKFDKNSPFNKEISTTGYST